MASVNRQAAQTRHARSTVLVALVLVVGALVASAGSAAGQEGEPPAPPASTTSTAPPVTVVLDDGDVAVVPPGATDPNAPSPPPADGSAPPAEGELAIPAEIPVVLLPDPTPGLNAALAAIDIRRAEDAVRAAEPGRVAAEQKVRDALAGASAATDARRAAGERVAAAKALVDELVANLVIFGDVVALEPVAGLATLDQLSDRELGHAAAEQLQIAYDLARREYADALVAEDRATAVVVAARTEARFVRFLYLEVRSRLDEAIRRAEEARRQLGPTILGPPVLTTDDLVAWYRTYYPADPPVAPIADIIDSYLRIGEEEGVTGDIAFAQAILETGGFRSGHAQGFNFAGIGAYDHCAPGCGFRFPNLDAGVRAHIHLLRAYADPGLTTAQLAAAPNRQVAPERVGVRGCCPRWTGLTGVWASDPQYDRKVLGIYRLMVETHRARQRFFDTAP